MELGERLDKASETFHDDQVKEANRLLGCVFLASLGEQVKRYGVTIAVGVLVAGGIAAFSTWESVTGDFFNTAAQVLAALLIAFALESRAIWREDVTDAVAARVTAAGGLGVVSIACALVAAEWQNGIARALLFGVVFAGFVWLGTTVAVTFPSVSFWRRSPPRPDLGRPDP